jgi:hypothetical protein
VSGDDLLIFDSCGSKRLLNAPTRVEPRPTVVSVANEKNRLLRHPDPPKEWFPQPPFPLASKPFATRDRPVTRVGPPIRASTTAKEVSPHQPRHGFANRFMRKSGHHVGALRGLMGHSRIDTTRLYTDEIELDELAAALDRAAAKRHAQASPDPTTLEAGLTDELERLRWRRRESNPRNVAVANRVGDRPPNDPSRRGRISSCLPP